MTVAQALLPPSTGRDGGPRTSTRTVRLRRVVATGLLVGPVVLSAWWAVHGDAELVNPGGLDVLGRLGRSLLHPALSAEFLGVVWHATLVTLAFAALGTGLALAIGVVGGLLLSDAAWPGAPGPVLSGVRWMARGLLVGARAIHEIVWALILVSVLGLDPLVGVLALGVPFGAQTAKVFADTIDGVDQGPVRALRRSGVSGGPAVAYGLLPAALPFLVSYAFYRFECSVRSAVILGVVGIGGLGQELVVSLQSRNWDEVWTLIYAVLIVSALADAWSARVRHDLAVASCSDWSSGEIANAAGTRRTRSSRWGRWSLLAMAAGLVVSWWATDMSLGGLFSERTRNLASELAADSWPPALPGGGWPELWGAIADTLAMAVLAMTIALVITVLVSPWAVRHRRSVGEDVRPAAVRTLRFGLRAGARGVLLVLRSIPPTVWAVAALLVLFPGVAPGALALGLYTGGIFGRLIAEAWEGIDLRPRDAVRSSGAGAGLAAIAAMVPPSTTHLTTYGLYRFEIAVRDTAIVGVVGAAGLGRLISENLAFFRFDVVAGLLIASLAVSVASEFLSRAVRRATHPA